jgi:hypothetical protein
MKSANDEAAPRYAVLSILLLVRLCQALILFSAPPCQALSLYKELCPYKSECQRVINPSYKF